MGYQTKVIRQFKGLSQNLALTAGAPEFALECVNVLPSIAGLAKLRIPTTLATFGTFNIDQFVMFEGENTKMVLAFPGTQIWKIQLDNFTPTEFDDNQDYIGPAPWSGVQANNWTFLQNGRSQPLKFTGAPNLLGWGIQEGQQPTITGTSGTGITLTTGRRYRIAYKNSTTGHVGTASPNPSDSSGAVSNQTINVSLPAPQFPDVQIDTVRIYATLDGGSDYFFHSELPAPAFPVLLDDDKPDADLDQSERAPLINDEPPIAKYLARWGARIFMFNLAGHNKWIAYTGYNRIFVGRPEETCPPGNRLKLDTGADEIAGGGVIDAGVIAFDVSNRMWMFRGQPEDIVIDAPVEFTLFLKELPWQIGCASHHSIQSTPRGLVWLSPSLDVFRFDGTSEPVSIDEGAEPILRSITTGYERNARSAYWQYKGRNWYVLGIPTNGATRLNKLLIFDLEPIADKNFGIVPIDVGEFDSLGIVEMLDHTQKLVIGQGTSLKELKVTPSTKNGIEENITKTDGLLGAFWESGYCGNEEPQREKFVRWCRVTADNEGIRVKRRLIRDKVTEPEIIEFVDAPQGGKISTNRKARRWSYELRFRDEDVSQNILELVDVSVPLGER